MIAIDTNLLAYTLRAGAPESPSGRGIPFPQGAVRYVIDASHFDYGRDRH